MSGRTGPLGGNSNRQDVDRLSAFLCGAEAQARKIRQALGPGITDALFAMLASDLQSAHERVQRIRERLEREPEGVR